MVAMNEILQLSERIVREFQPERVILFGSYAYGTPDADSDVDLLVVLPFEGKGYRKSLEIMAAVEPPFAVDLLVRTPQQIQQRLEWNDFFIREIIEKGKVLYEAPRC
ncbi:MAG: nucleotidyltransferase domain-containing protein [Anaerolineae bacterium]|nr:nucleotidyltransferase domain-containing protein [Anaerolineae bacterium]